MHLQIASFNGRKLQEQLLSCGTFQYHLDILNWKYILCCANHACLIIKAYLVEYLLCGVSNDEKINSNLTIYDKDKCCDFKNKFYFS